MTLTAPQRLVETRSSWHRVAEHVLAAGQCADAGTIRLRTWPGGIATVRGVGGRQLGVVGDELVVVAPDGSRRSAPLTTLGAAAAFAGISPGLTGTYPPATPADPDTPLKVDATAARLLADWYALGDAALRRFAEVLGRPEAPVLWPEHLDVGLTVDEVNYVGAPAGAEETREAIEHGVQICMKEMSAAGTHPILVAADVSSEDQVAAMFDQVLGEYGRVDYLINSAGIQVAAETHELPVAA